ncbi:MAG: hypothetical protein ABFC67_07765 [Mizugakiibacter sp.]|uniref:hypothetical protein n=1 Tax=Mizugakiibacter sp. TaxID=1972610 RepID=UPI00320F41E7
MFSRRRRCLFLLGLLAVLLQAFVPALAMPVAAHRGDAHAHAMSAAMGGHCTERSAHGCCAHGQGGDCASMGGCAPSVVALALALPPPLAPPRAMRARWPAHAAAPTALPTAPPLQPPTT